MNIDPFNEMESDILVHTSNHTISDPTAIRDCTYAIRMYQKKECFIGALLDVGLFVSRDEEH